MACTYVLIAALDGVLVALSWQPEWIHFAQVADVISTLFCIVLEAYPLVLLAYALRKPRQLNSASLLVATLAFLDELLIVFGNVVKQGHQTAASWIADKLDAPLFSIGSTGISLPSIAGTFLFIAIVYAVYDSVREEQRRSDVLERERIVLLRESDRMRHQAEHDGLTGLRNHHSIVERLGQEMSHSLCEGIPLSVVLIDIDHFKKINDSYGHLAGDLVLREIGAIFKRSLGVHDSVGRYGGEEFLLILPNCEIENCLTRAEQLRAAVESKHFMDGETRLPVTASFGVATLSAELRDADAVIRAADAALYRAKSDGRNCVIRANTDRMAPK